MKFLLVVLFVWLYINNPAFKSSTDQFASDLKKEAVEAFSSIQH